MEASFIQKDVDGAAVVFDVPVITIARDEAGFASDPLFLLNRLLQGAGVVIDPEIEILAVEIRMGGLLDSKEIIQKGKVTLASVAAEFAPEAIGIPLKDILFFNPFFQRGLLDPLGRADVFHRDPLGLIKEKDADEACVDGFFDLILAAIIPEHLFHQAMRLVYEKAIEEFVGEIVQSERGTEEVLDCDFFLQVPF